MASQRRAISGGTGAPPDVQSRSEPRSYSGVFGWFTIATLTVAINVVIVQRCCWMARSAVSTSKRCSATRVAPV